MAVSKLNTIVAPQGSKVGVTEETGFDSGAAMKDYSIDVKTGSM